uniref:Uncharacterized protein n=1 Tax=Ditylenchus dipsaci TaxID=166011 RepID=A0A915EPM4_9BILA
MAEKRVPFALLDVKCPHEVSSTGSLVNPKREEVVLSLNRSLLKWKACYPSKRVMVVGLTVAVWIGDRNVNDRKQCGELVLDPSDELGEASTEIGELEIGTVDDMQGKVADIVVVMTTRDNESKDPK